MKGGVGNADGLPPRQTAAVEELAAALDAFGAALLAAQAAGLPPADALRACGIQLPAWAGPAVDRLLKTGAAQDLQSDADCVSSV